MPAPTPPAEIDLSATLVRELLVVQHPDLAELPLGLLANGWDNVLFRLGEELVVRLPRRALAAALVEHEQTWLPLLAPRLPLPIPAPTHVGRPALGYPWRWSVVPFLPGEIAARARFERPAVAAATLGEFLRALHQPAPADAPANPFRGVPLAERDDAMRRRLAGLADLVDVEAATRVWDDALARPASSGPAVWLHGDLHPANLLVHDGALSAVIDFGDLTAGDRATDLSVAWMAFSPDDRAVFRSAYGNPDDDTWARARGWACGLALAFLAHSSDNPLMAAIGSRALDAVLSEQPW
ncbi:MAG TPA: aminoglycoside phosphotransferase family protein [Acidothermaceae bacterium]